MLPLGCVCAVAHWGRAGGAAIYGAAPIFTLRMGERSGVQICLLVVFGAVRGLLFSAKDLFLAAKARRQRA
jgi:hypothetical protein